MKIAKIQPSHFFTTEAEKTHLNWFLFELAAEMKSAIDHCSLAAKLKKKGYTESEINFSCINFAKLLKGNILDFLNYKIPQMVIDYQLIEAAFPNLNDKLTDALLDSSAKGWDMLLSGCSICPTACQTNRTKKCPFFEDASYYD